ncbi:hypothetical protein [Streptomyces sp. G45]|uniref:hypothetical protein n=1 Tax=Streptomyces sp. G45 TaxID=3406627 RepID=UPI003C1FA4D5
MTSTHTSARDARALAGLSAVRAGGSGATAQRPLRIAVCLLPALVIAVAGFQRRWMSDDAHIYVRTVRQILAGNGPVFNAGERAESSTGTLWQWLLALAGLLGADVVSAAVYGGLLLTAAGVALGAWGAVRLRDGGVAGAEGVVGAEGMVGVGNFGGAVGVGGGRGRGAWVPVPLGVLVLLALPPVWDFATSGLETGLATCWLAGAWLLLVTRPRALVTAFVSGLGPLVRPDLALVSAVFLAAQWLIARPTRRAALGGAAVAGALPVAYEVFRMGYYGHLVPLPAVTKEASDSLWGRGLGYLADFAGPYLLWLPALFIVAAVVPSGRGARGLRGGRGVRGGYGVPLVPAGAPVVAGLLCWGYVIKVGGDFMHGRMFLPGLLLLLLPVFVVPATRAWGLAATGVCAWALVCAAVLRVPYEGRIGPGGIADERGVYVRQNAAAHPLRHTFAGYPYNAGYARDVRDAVRRGEPALFLARTAVRSGSPSVTGAYVTLGLNGTVVPLDGAALDPIGLAYPLAAHSERIAGARVGHDKRLPDEWIVADRGVVGGVGTAGGSGAVGGAGGGARAGVVPKGMDAGRVAAARRALGCGGLRELREATRGELTWGRFWRNVGGVVGRTQLRFPNDPVRAEGVLCR